MSSPKNEQIRKAAGELFWKYGFTRVTVEEICREAGVSKMTFYKYYRNKNDLVKSIMEEKINEGMARYREIMSSDLPYTKKVEQIILQKMEHTRDMSSEFLRDYFSSGDEELMAFANEKTRASVEMVTEDFHRAQEQGLIREDIRIGFIMYFINKMVHLAQDEELKKQYESINDLIMELTRFFFYGVMKRI
ncbi:MAG TPA: TetR/AcrR family transcriptional regulator [Bacteroidetes bacterium]|nr:TetR/AcrR family transcriptional regulator [Bacteroidota bacterium]